MKKDFWYNPQITLSHNALLNYVVGARGVGKTYGTTKLGIKRFLKGKGTFIYLRRYKTELVDFEKQFNAVSKDEELKDYIIGVKGKKAYIVKKTDNEEQDIKNLYKQKNMFCQAVALSTAVSKKSADYSDVSMILFDEFIIEKSSIHYLPNEVEALLGFMETVGRMRDDFVVMAMSNSVTWNNPHFQYWGCRNRGREFAHYKDGLILVQNVDSTLYSQQKATTKMGRLMLTSDYGRYTIGNEFINDDTPFIELKTEKAVHIFSINIGQKHLGAWIDYDEDKLYLSNKVGKNDNVVYSLMTEDREPCVLWLKAHKKNYHYQLLKLAYENSNLYFTSQDVFFTCKDIGKIFSF